MIVILGFFVNSDRREDGSGAKIAFLDRRMLHCPLVSSKSTCKFWPPNMLTRTPRPVHLVATVLLVIGHTFVVVHHSLHKYSAREGPLGAEGQLHPVLHAVHLGVP